MRIAVVHSFYSRSSPSGENAVVADQVKQLRSSGYDVRLISKETDDESKSPLYGLRAALTASDTWGPSPAALLREFDPDVVHVHNLFPNWRSNWLRQWGTRTVYTLHNYRTVCAAATLFRAGQPCTQCLDHSSLRSVVHKCYRGSSVATVPLALATRGEPAQHPALLHPHTLVTLNSSSEIIFKKYVPDANIVTVPNFANTDSKPREQHSGRFIYVGRLTDEKGILKLLDSWPAHLPLDIVGSGPLEDLVSQRLNQAEADIKFHGRKEPKATLDMIATSAGLVVPSLWSEGIPTVALEALAAGTPLVVSSNLASAPNLIANSAGVQYEPVDAASLLSALGEVLRAGPAMRSHARSNYVRTYDVSVWQQSMDDIYRRVFTDNSNRA